MEFSFRISSIKSVRREACDFDSSLSFRDITPELSIKATEQSSVAVSRQIIILTTIVQVYFSLKSCSFLTTSIRVLSVSFLLIALKGAVITLSFSATPDRISIYELS